MVQDIFEISKNLIEEIKNPKILIEKLEAFKGEGIRYSKEKNQDAFQYTNRLYQVTFNHAKKIGADISKYPINLEELTK